MVLHGLCPARRSEKKKIPSIKPKFNAINCGLVDHLHLAWLVGLTSQCGVDILNIHLKEDQQLKARLEELIFGSSRGIGSDVNRNFLQNLLVQAIIGELLSAVEEIKKLKSQVDEERAKNAKLLNEMKKLSQIFEEEQCKSTKLSETISLLQGNCKTVEHLTIRNRELEMERDQTVSELPQLKSWDEVLKAFYEIEEKSKQQYQEKYESNTAEISALREQLIRVEEDLKCLKMGRKNSMNSSNLVSYFNVIFNSYLC